MTSHQQTPPQDLPAEQGLLGGCIAHGADVVGFIADILEPDDFFDRRHAAIYLAIHQLWDRGTAVDEITVASYLADGGRLEMVGGPQYLGDLADIIITPSHVEHYARLIRKKSVLRRMLASLDKARARIFAVDDPDVVMGEVQEGVNKLALTAHQGGAISNRELMDTVFTRARQRQQQKEDPDSVPFGLQPLDDVTGGMQRGDLIVPAGRPGMGKSSFALRVAVNVAVDQRLPVLFATQEQTEKEMGNWLVCSVAGINTMHWRTGNIAPADMTRADVKRPVLEKAPLYWLCGPAGGLRGIEAQARSIQAREGDLGLIVVDYIQLFAKRLNDEEIGAVSRALKQMAMRLKVPMLAVSQLNRDVEKRPINERRPVITDLRGSGSLEQDANVVILLYRPAEYGQADPGQEGLVLVNIPKHRGGPKGTKRLWFTPEHVRFGVEGENVQPQREMYS